jgi:hypothetical protein
VVRFKVTLLGSGLEPLDPNDGTQRSFRVTRTLAAPDALVASERAISVVRCDRALSSGSFDPWYPPQFEVTDVVRLDAATPAEDSEFEWLG